MTSTCYIRNILRMFGNTQLAKFELVLDESAQRPLGDVKTSLTRPWVTKPGGEVR
jgi:hypothetical protein